MDHQTLKELAKVTRPTFAKLYSVTIPQMRKTNNPFFGNCFKHAESSVILGANYESLVNNARIKEEWARIEEEAAQYGHTSLPDVISWAEEQRIIRNNEFDVDAFNAQKRTWGENIPGTSMSQDGDKLFLNLCVLSSKYSYMDSFGGTLDKDRVESFMNKKKNKSQGLQNPIKWCNYGFDSIVGIKVGGKYYN